MEEKFCEIFRTGTHTSGEGVTKNWTTDDLDTMVRNFYEKNSDVPLVVGHPKTNDPAYGWFKNLKRSGERLLASFKQVAPEFAEAVNAGRFKTRSIAVAPDGSIRHLGWLGATPPAIKGLAGFQFQEDENAEVYEFSESNDFKFEITGSIFERIRDFFIEKFKLETADRLISRYEIEKLKELENKTPEEVAAFCAETSASRSTGVTEVTQVTDLTPELNTSSPEGGEMEYNMTEEQKQPSETQNFAEEIKRRDETIAQLKTEKAELEARSRQERHLQFAEKAVENGNITPAQKADVAAFLEAAYKADTADGQSFSEENSETFSAKLKSFISGLKQVTFSETDPDKIDDAETLNFNDPIAVSNAVEELVAESKAKGKPISESQALKQLKG